MAATTRRVKAPKSNRDVAGSRRAAQLVAKATWTPAEKDEALRLVLADLAARAPQSP